MTIFLLASIREAISVSCSGSIRAFGGQQAVRQAPLPPRSRRAQQHGNGGQKLHGAVGFQSAPGAAPSEAQLLGRDQRQPSPSRGRNQVSFSLLRKEDLAAQGYQEQQRSE